MSNTLLEVKGLRTYFFTDEGIVKAVDGADFSLDRGMTLGVVGESGCGKSVTAQSILRIVPDPGKIVSGEILLHRNREPGYEEIIDLTKLDPDGEEIRAIRGAVVSMIFQEPMTSFSPVHTVGHQIMEAILLHQDVTKEEARELAIEALDDVGIPDPQRQVDEFPFRLSGGMLQRAMIAMALSCRPSLLIADEPTTSLDVTVQAQILELMNSWQERLGMAIMIITHDLGVISEMAEQVVVMYWGKIVEECDVDTIFHNPRHPYMASLLKSIPRVGQEVSGRLPSIRGVVPDPFARLKGCAFYPRCPRVMPGVCNVGNPPALVEIESGHKVSCFLYGDRREDDGNE